jgi:hypothetical protein
LLGPPSRRLYVAIGDPGVVCSLDSEQLELIETVETEKGAHTIGWDPDGDIGGFDCNPAGPFGSYHWAVSVNTLTLTSTQEGCPGRQGILQGTWTRVP